MVVTQFGSHGCTTYLLVVHQTKNWVSTNPANRAKTAVDGSWVGRLSRENLRVLKAS
jgi:hypothetical protein